MNSTPELKRAARAVPPEFEAFPDLISAEARMIDRGDALEAYRAFDDGALAEVPRALEAYIGHQRFALI
jgi:hypothetical protein